MLERFTVMVRPVLTGLIAAEAATVTSTDEPGDAVVGDTAATPLGLVGSSTRSAMAAEPLRAWASVIVTGSDRVPGVVFAGIAALNEYRPSAAARSPCVPSSYSVCVALPPMAVRFACIVTPVLAGPWAGT